MNELSVMLENCYGIQDFQHDFNFSSSRGQASAYYQTSTTLAARIASFNNHTKSKSVASSKRHF
jgi:hypothetical protein